jgi:outer membrane receptor protein involved in Fe transport
VYDIDSKHYVKLLYGSAYRAPSSNQLFSNYIKSGGVIGNPDLRPERARTFEAALGVSPIEGMATRLNAFYTRIEDRVEVERPALTSNFSNRMPKNGSPIDSFGGEAQLDYRFADYAGFVSYSYQTSSFPRVNTLSIEREVVDVKTPAYADHLVKFGASADFPEIAARTSVTGRWVGRRLGSLENNSLINGRDFLVERYSLEPYLLVDVAVSTIGLKWFGHRETKFQGKIRNLFNTEYVFPFYAQFDVPGFTRTFELSIQQDL